MTWSEDDLFASFEGLPFKQRMLFWKKVGAKGVPSVAEIRKKFGGKLSIKFSLKSKNILEFLREMFFIFYGILS